MNALQLTFPQPILTVQHQRQPGAAGYRLLKREILGNARAIPNPTGDPNGFMGAVVTAEEWLTMPGVTGPYMVPAHPGGHPGHAAAASGAAITETNRAYTANVAAYERYTQVTQALKQQVFQAVPSDFYRGLYRTLDGYGSVTIQELLLHIQDEFGPMRADELTANRARLEADWNPDDPIQTLFTRTRECREIAAEGNDPITEATAVRAMQSVLERTGLFTDALRIWRRRPITEHTLVNFYDEMRMADVERTRNVTASNAGFHGANAAVAAGTDGLARGAPTGGRNNTSSIRTNQVEMYYCYSHGLGLNPNHTGHTCRNPNATHIATATADNMQGGRNIIIGPPNGQRGGPRPAPNGA